MTQWLLNHRLTAAQRLLETTGKSVDVIAGLVGFGSAVSLRQHFAQTFAISPSAYRKQFGTTAPSGRVAA
ncbi:transcriptional activator FtrA [compost metagenome]